MKNYNFDMVELVNPIEYMELVNCGFIKYDIINNKFKETFVHDRVIQSYYDLIIMAQYVRDIVGSPCIVNNYHKDKNFIDIIKDFDKDTDFPKLVTYYQLSNSFKDSGTRDLFYSLTGSKLSVHRLKKAVDIKVPKFDKLPQNQRKEAYYNIKKQINPKYSLELGVTWIHIDSYFRPNGIRLYDAKGNVYKSFEDWENKNE